MDVVGWHSRLGGFIGVQVGQNVGGGHRRRKRREVGETRKGDRVKTNGRVVGERGVEWTVVIGEKASV